MQFLQASMITHRGFGRGRLAVPGGKRCPKHATITGTKYNNKYAPGRKPSHRKGRGISVKGRVKGRRGRNGKNEEGHSMRVEGA